ncbi:MAG: D-aminoacyl-tRNA deacylase [Salinisphaeraceae bacterium]|nr:D-aminoacyl-tRNA deacylase [Salinisphaeraceae bacterium]
MIGLLQRVTQASVTVDDERIASIDHGLMVLVGIEQQDDAAKADRLLEKLLAYRVFADAQGRMNQSLTDIGGGLLLVPQFTLVADTTKGLRPSFASAAAPNVAQQLFGYLCERAAAQHATTAFGRFGADMQVALVNDGPVTFRLQV